MSERRRIDRWSASLARLAAATIAAALVAPGCGTRSPSADERDAAPAGGSRLNLLFVTVDTLRADHLGCYGYAAAAEPTSPHVDALAAEGMRFERCFAPRGETAPSLCSLMTGCYPARHGVMENQQPFADGVPTLPEILNAAGFVTGAFVSVLPGSQQGKAYRGFSEVVDARSRHRDGDQRTWDDVAEHSLTRFLAERTKDPRPFCAWVHFYDVHFPFMPPAPWDRRFGGDYDGPMQWDASRPRAEYDRAITGPLDAAMVRRAPLAPADATFVTALYDAGIRATDERIGRIVARLAELGLDDTTLVLFSADHGEELAEHNQHWFHASSVYESVLHVPLIVRGPGIAPGVTDRIVQNVDVLPTLLERLGLAAPIEPDGVAFGDALWADAPSHEPRTIAWSEWQDLILGARTERWKLIVNPRGARPKKPPYFMIEDDPGYFVDCFELYDLRADPREQQNVWDERRDEVADLRALAAQEYARRFAGVSGVVPEESDAAERAALEQLGYAAGGEARKDVVFAEERCTEE